MYGFTIAVILQSVNPPLPHVSDVTFSNYTRYLTLYSPIKKIATARKRARCDLTVLQKTEMCEFKTKHAKSTQEQIAEHFSSKWSFHITRRIVGDVLSARQIGKPEKPKNSVQARVQTSLFDNFAY